MSKLINFLTISRILFGAIIFLILSFTQNYLLTLILVFIASISDFLDGFLARKYGLVSALGEILDPIADKIFIVFLFLSVSINLSSNYIGFIAALIISREIWVAALRDYNSRVGNTEATKVTFLAKIKTSAQFAALITYIFGMLINNMLVITIADIFLLIALLITLQTAYVYTAQTFKKE